MLAVPAWARDLWVHPSGSDSNPCTDSTTALSAGASRATIQGLNTCSPTLGPGDTVHVNTGTYAALRGTINGGTLPSGASGNPITFVSVTQYGAKVGFIEMNPYWVVDGFTVDGLFGAGNECVGMSNATLKNSEVINCPHQGILGGGDNLISNNKIHNVAISGDFLDHGVYMNGDNNVIEYNEVYNINGGWGVQFYSGSTSHNIVRY